jgi:serine/threonine-protein kinase
LVDDPEMRAALRREAEIALRLRHPNVVRLRGIELEDEVPVLVMDYVEGTTLADLVRDWLKHDRKDTARGALRIILDAAEGLHALHELRGERGEPLALVHRDVSPQNVLVGLDGRARVSDFGLTKCLATDRATTEGVLKGKAGYLAPEYIRGERGDRRQDVFSLAIVAWEALTKSRLFRGENEAQTLDFVLTMEIPSITTKAPELVDAATKIDPVLQRALARDPQDRYESALAFGQALTEAAMASGLLGTDADVRAGFSPGLATELGARRVALGREERARNNRFIASAVLATGMFALATALVVRPRAGADTAVVNAPRNASVTASPATAPAPAPTNVEPAASMEVMSLPDAPPTKTRHGIDRAKPRPSAEPAKAAEPNGKPRPNPY